VPSGEEGAGRLFRCFKPCGRHHVERSII
jgi:hypothetical protein